MQNDKVNHFSLTYFYSIFFFFDQVYQSIVYGILFLVVYTVNRPILYSDFSLTVSASTTRRLRNCQKWKTTIQSMFIKNKQDMIFIAYNYVIQSSSSGWRFSLKRASDGLLCHHFSFSIVVVVLYVPARKRRIQYLSEMRIACMMVLFFITFYISLSQ